MNQIITKASKNNDLIKLEIILLSIIYSKELAKDYFNRMPEHKVIKGIISPVSDYYETKKKLESSEHRCQMVRKSLVPLKNQENWIQLDDWESRQNRWLRTIDVFNHHFKQINDGMNEQINLKLLCGADLFETFNVPNLWLDEDIEEIVSKYGLVVVTRVGFDPFKTLESSGKSKILLKHKVWLIFDPTF